MARDAGGFHGKAAFETESHIWYFGNHNCKHADEANPGVAAKGDTFSLNLIWFCCCIMLICNSCLISKKKKKWWKFKKENNQNVTIVEVIQKSRKKTSKHCSPKFVLLCSGLGMTSLLWHLEIKRKCYCNFWSRKANWPDSQLWSLCSATKVSSRNLLSSAACSARGKRRYFFKN